MKGRMTRILESELERIKPSSQEEERMGRIVMEFLKKLNSNLRKSRAEAMMGGSFAKGTTIRKRRYDVDLFALFKDDEGISDKLEKALRALKIRYDRLPGSRDYFSINMNSEGLKFKVEIVPVFRIRKSGDARNVTDVSMLHVDYVKKKIRKNPKLADDIRMAKAFCYARDCYGAESHIKGFSGYCLEILTANYGSFLSLMRNAAKWNEKVVIDPEKFYGSKDEIMNELNEAKLASPLILIDPVQKNRNAAAALGKEKYKIFVDAARRFLKSPSRSFFERKEFDPERLKKDARRKKLVLFEVDAMSKRAKEDISGAKLLKLHNVMVRMLEKEGYKVESKWVFSENSSKSYMTLKKPKKIMQKGPPVARLKHAEEFRRRWKKVFVKQGNLYTERKPKDAGKILNLDKKLLKDMGIDSFKVGKIL